MQDRFSSSINKIVLTNFHLRVSALHSNYEWCSTTSPSFTPSFPQLKLAAGLRMRLACVTHFFFLLLLILVSDYTHEFAYIKKNTKIYITSVVI